MNYSGIIIGLATFLIIGICHPIVIKAEYHHGTKCWWIFALVGALAICLSLLFKNFVASTIFGVMAFSAFWSIIELFEQKQRVKKGWFPKNPKREKNY